MVSGDQRTAAGDAGGATGGTDTMSGDARGTGTSPAEQLDSGGRRATATPRPTAWAATRTHRHRGTATPYADRGMRLLRTGSREHRGHRARRTLIR